MSGYEPAHDTLKALAAALSAVLLRLEDAQASLDAIDCRTEEILARLGERNLADIGDSERGASFTDIPSWVNEPGGGGGR